MYAGQQARDYALQFCKTLSPTAQQQAKLLWHLQLLLPILTRLDPDKGR
jgi:hypothetical protein